MKKYLIQNEGKFYKANLHCHTTVSDGANTPEEMKNYYKAHGYSILAMTDHELLVDHSDLNDDEFLTITGYEYAFVEFSEPTDYPKSHTLEFNLFARNPHNENHICFNPANVIHGEKWRTETLKYAGEIYNREFTLESMQYVIDEARRNGFIVSINHPHYSFVSPELFGKLKGLFAMEIHNQGSFYNSCDYNPQMYDQMLRLGHKISCLATDDNHYAYVYDDETDPRPWGYSMIKAKNLTYEDVFNALENGDYYATQGPKINELYVEDGMVHLKCSEAIAVVMITKERRGGVITSENGKRITEATFPLPDDEYMRFDVIDAFGRHANTRAYYLGNLK